MYRKEDESRDEYDVWCNGIKVTLYGMCELFDQKMVEVVATSSVRQSNVLVGSSVDSRVALSAAFKC